MKFYGSWLVSWQDLSYQGCNQARNDSFERWKKARIEQCEKSSVQQGRYLMCSQVFKSLNQFWLGATFFSTGNKMSLRSLGCHPLVLLLQGAWANWPMSWLRWHRYLLRICSQAGWTFGDKRPNLGISDWYGWKSFLVSIQEISAPHDPLIQWSWLQGGKFLVWLSALFFLGRAMQMLDRWWFNSSDREQKLGMA